MGMGPRIREDNGRGWIPACVFMGVGSVREDGSPPRLGGVSHARTREGVDSCCVFTGVGSAWEDGLGPRMREDKGRGWGRGRV